MYEELVELLREAPDDWPDADLHYEAADAIEELSNPQNTVHLCASCKKYQNQFPVCMPSKGIVFGCGKGNDNICQCPEYVAIAPRWIPVTERLPESSGTHALVMRFDYVTNTPFYDLLWFDSDEWWNRNYTGDFAVTHWMPLPELPKEET